MNIIGPYELSDYKSAPKSKGLYVIGSKCNELKPMTKSFYEDPYFSWCPVNFKPRYVGVSESERSGVRARLSSHARSKGNKRIAALLESKEPLWYICIEGEDKVILEAIFLCLKGGAQFDCNIRSENKRSAKREYQKVRNSMTSAEKAFLDGLDMGPHGNGM